MEGISGTYGHSDAPLVKRMLRKISHRGPDASSVIEDDGAVLGARESRTGAKARLRPISEGGGVAVASDSCIFNRELLHERFMGPVEGRFRDQELLSEMYRQLGTSMFGHLDGAYAVAIHDRGRTVLARDRYGLKPLYLSGGVRRGTYSSEMKSQLLAEDDFLPFPPGRFLVQGKGFFPIRPRARGPPLSRCAGKAGTLRSRIVDGVEGAMEGAHGLNILLSGGVDSSVVACAASLVTDDIDSVCAGAEGGVDLEMARAVAERLGTRHRELMYDTDDMLEALDRVVRAAETFDYPLVRSCIPNFMVTHAFHDRTRITLCGEGGDEIFAGYDYMRDIKGDEQLRAERMTLLKTGHMTGFQRVDRMTASASLDGRMPQIGRAHV